VVVDERLREKEFAYSTGSPDGGSNKSTQSTRSPARGCRVLVIGHQVVVLCFRYLLEHLDEAALLAIDRKGEVANCSVTEYCRNTRGDHTQPLELRRYN
jgi:broad specificity phosphatase PhoE